MDEVHLTTNWELIWRQVEKCMRFNEQQEVDYFCASVDSLLSISRSVLGEEILCKITNRLALSRAQMIKIQDRNYDHTTDLKQFKGLSFENVKLNHAQLKLDLLCIALGKAKYRTVSIGDV